jgi:eukaryotic-like serine/threonine-protein kinase
MIKCPSCGREAPASARRCLACASPLPAVHVTTALLTPVPISGPDAVTETGTGQPAAHSHTGPTVGFTPGQTFGQRYHIISLLGIGGMGAVYHVWDVELGMAVALKVIRPDSDPSNARELERRFKRELVLARQVTHPNVIRIHDLGEIDGIKFITMPLVLGTDLARLLATGGKLPVPRALAIAKQIASGLKAAHEVGVIHRDLKPANILLDIEDHTQITDFGIARSTDAATMATAAGVIVGTLAYMAPEQAMGKPVDQRADVYAFGLIVYEMLTGRPPSAGSHDSALAMLMARAHSAPARLRSIDPTIPEAVDRIVARCLEPNPEQRYQSVAAVHGDLDRLDANGHEIVVPAPRRMWPMVAAAVLLLAAIITAVWTWPRAGAPGPAPAARDPVSVLVADFNNQANDPVFQGSLEQALSIAIEGASFITTYPRTTAGTVGARIRSTPNVRLDEEMARLVARSEGIKVVLTGNIAARDGGGYDVQVRAVDPSDGKELAVARDRVSDKANVLKGLERVASQLRNALGDTTPESGRLAAAETVTAASLEALHSYSIAQDLSSTGREEESIKHYRDALARDPNFGRAYSGWATALFNLGRRDEAAQVWQKALSQMDRMTEREALRTRGAYFLGTGGSYRQAIDQFEKLVEKYPADRAAHQNLAIAYLQTLQFAKAMEEGRKAAEIYPQYTRTRSNYALLAMYASDFTTAKAEASKVIQQNQVPYKAYLPLAAAAHVAEDFAGMRQAYDQMRQKGGMAGASLAVHGLADLDAYEGRLADATAILKAGIVADEAVKNNVAEAAKLVVRADVELASSQPARAADTARQALSLFREEATLVPSALVFLQAGRTDDARAIAKELGAQIQPRPRAYAALIEGEIARAARHYADAADHFTRAATLADVWLARFYLGVTYIEAGRYPEAQGELPACLKRRGEAMALFFDDVPTFRYLAPLQYWLGRAQEGLGVRSSAAMYYKRFLSLRPEAPRDALVIDAKKRLESLIHNP